MLFQAFVIHELTFFRFFLCRRVLIVKGRLRGVQKESFEGFSSRVYSFLIAFLFPERRLLVKYWKYAHEEQRRCRENEIVIFNP